MRAPIRAEFIKLATTRTALGLILGAAAVASLGAFSTIMSAETVDGAVRAQNFFILASVNLALFAAIVGVRSFTDDFRNGSIVPTLLLTPSRARVVVAKVATSFAIGAVMAAVASLMMLLLAVPLAASKGGELDFGAADAGAVAGLILASALWSAIGASGGAIVRHQVPAVVAALVWILLLENLGSGLLGDIGRYLPGQAGHALAQAERAGPLLSPGAAALLLCAYAALAAAVAVVLTNRRDVAAI